MAARPRGPRWSAAATCADAVASWERRAGASRLSVRTWRVWNSRAPKIGWPSARRRTGRAGATPTARAVGRQGGPAPRPGPSLDRGPEAPLQHAEVPGVLGLCLQVSAAWSPAQPTCGTPENAGPGAGGATGRAVPDGELQTPACASSSFV